jgi:hypothetical protein
MSQIVKAWLAIAALGAGVIHLSVVVSSPLPLAVAMLLVGLAELVWALLALIRDRVPFARTARLAAIAPVALWALLIVAASLGLDGAGTWLPLVPMALASLFSLFIAITLSLQLRAGRADDTAPAPPAGRYLLALAAAAAIVGGLTTPALAASEAGLYAVPHGTHGSTEPGGHGH